MDIQELVLLAEKQLLENRHILITGMRGSGKSTLLKAIVDKVGKGNIFPSIITWSQPGKAVYMRQLGCDENIVIGRYNEDIASAENKMLPVRTGFDVSGIAVLNTILEENSELIIIDEIGYLEAECSIYLKKLDEVFEKKRVIAVVRKQNIEHINQLLNRKDAFVIDLDKQGYINNIPAKNCTYLESIFE